MNIKQTYAARRCFWLTLVPTWLAMAASSYAAENGIWNLESSIQRSLQVAPELAAVSAKIRAQQGRLRQAGNWPNPSLEFRLDNKLGQEDSAGGRDLTRFAFSQSLPIRRLSRQRRAAAARLSMAQENRRYQQLLLEHRIARSYHSLQLAKAKLQLAKHRLNVIDALITGKRKNRKGVDPLIRYLSPLTRNRLSVIRGQAKQEVAVAEGQYEEAALTFRTLLNLTGNSSLELMPLVPIKAILPLSKLQSSFRVHPLFDMGKYRLKAAHADVDIARALRFGTPKVSLFRERDFLAGRRRNINGMELSIQIPFWNLNKGGITAARSHVAVVQYRLQAQRRDMQNKFNLSYRHLNHLIEQTKHYRLYLLQPARRVFNLARKGFAAGGLNVLTFVDANNTYFNARVRYLELLRLCRLEAAEIRLNAGLSIANSGTTTGPAGTRK